MNSIPRFIFSVCSRFLTIRRSLVSLLILSVLGFTTDALALEIGDGVEANATVNVRQTPAGSVLGTQPYASRGVILAGPQTASLGGTSYTWWQVNFSSNPSGWVADIGLNAVSPSAPTLTSPGSATGPGTAVSTLTPTLTWSAENGANNYGVYVYDITEGSLVYSNVSVGDSTSVSVGPLVAGHSYRWNAQASDSAGYGGYSSFLYFVEQASAPSISSVSPDPVTGANTAQSLTIFGSGFVSSAQVNLACPAFSVNATISATYVNSSELQLSAIFGNDPSSWTAKVINPGNVLSAPSSFSVNAPLPVIQSLAPSSAVAGGPAFSLIVNGSTFDQGSIVMWNGSPLSTKPTVNSGGLTTALTATVAANEIASSGTAQVTVSNPSPGGGVSSAAPFTVNAGSRSFVFGFDSSAIQQKEAINWQEVGAAQISYDSQQYPVSFVILRASKGNADVDNCRFKDPDFVARATAAANAGLLVGAYHVAGVSDVSTGDSYSAASEADFFVQIAGPWIGSGFMRPFLDVEDDACATRSTYPAIATWIDSWMQEVQSLTGVTPVIYCNEDFAEILQSLSAKYDLWIARPGTDPSANPDLSPWTIDLIQYDWSGSVSGIDTPVDLDVFQGNMAAFEASLVPGATPPPATTSVTLASVPSGLTVMVDGSAYPTPQTVTWQAGSSHTLSTDGAQVTPDGETRYSFSSWSDGGNLTHNVSPSSPVTYTADFETNYLLVATASPAPGGSVLATPAGPWFAPGAIVSLTATSEPGYEFVVWSGEESFVNNIAQTLMNGPETVTATFAPIPPPPQFATVTATSGNIQLGLSGVSPGMIAVLESSLDLKTWTPIATNSVSSTTVSLSIPINAAIRAQFLRVAVH